MSNEAVAFSRARQHNKFWPLPPDYGRLTNSGRREARVALFRGPCTSAQLVVRWRFFCEHYLVPPECGFYDDYHEPAPFHHLLIHDIGRYPLNMYSAYRGSGKTVTLRSFITMLGPTWPNREVIWVKSTVDHQKDDFDRIERQWLHNARIIDDFGRIKPKRGEGGRFSLTRIALTNGFRMSGFAIEVASRGPHPALAILDDVEWDEAKPERAAELTVITEKKIKDVYLPMMGLKGASLLFIGTTRLNSFLHQCIRSEDPTLDSWNRRHFQAKADSGQIMWEKFDDKAIEIIQNRVGPQAFASEFQGNPRVEGFTSFPFDERLHTYGLKEDDGLWGIDPRASKSILTRCARAPELQGGLDKWESQLGAELLADSFVFMTTDSKKKPTPNSDFAGCLVCAADPFANLWILDLFLGRVPKDKHMDEIIRLAMKWGVRLICPESVAVQAELPELIRGVLADQFFNHMGYVPVVLPGQGKFWNSKKGDRIGTVQWRFVQNKIFMPAWLLNDFPMRELKNQIKQFSGDPEALPFDDAIDMLGTTTFVLRNRHVSPAFREPVKSAMAQRLDDPIWKEANIHPLSGVDVTKLSREDIEEIERRQNEPVVVGSPRYRMNRPAETFRNPSEERAWIRKLFSSFPS